MRSKRLVALAALILAAPAQADVTVAGPPLPPLELSKAHVAKMAQSARAAVTAIFDFGGHRRSEYLNNVYREAGKQQIASVEKIVSVRVLGDRAFVLTVTQNWLGPQTMGPAYTYFQCQFDEAGEVTKVNII